MSLTDAIGVGPIMYAEVSHWTWDALSNPERIAGVESLGGRTRERGFAKLYLTDENRAHLASWSGKKGARLIEP